MSKLGTVVQTVVEAVGLVTWLGMLMSGGSGLASFGVLAVFLTLEHIVAYNNAHGRRLLVDPRGTPLLKLAGVSVSEAGLWAAWFALLPVSGLLAAAVLAIGMVPQHAIEFNVVEHAPAFHRLFRQRRTLAISAIEAATGAGWFAALMAGQSAVAGGVLGVGLMAEHLIQGAETKVDVGMKLLARAHDNIFLR